MKFCSRRRSAEHLLSVMDQPTHVGQDLTQNQSINFNDRLINQLITFYTFLNSFDSEPSTCRLQLRVISLRRKRSHETGVFQGKLLRLDVIKTGGAGWAAGLKVLISVLGLRSILFWWIQMFISVRLQLPHHTWFPLLMPHMPFISQPFCREALSIKLKSCSFSWESSLTSLTFQRLHGTISKWIEDMSADIRPQLALRRAATLILQTWILLKCTFCLKYFGFVGINWIMDIKQSYFPLCCAFCQRFSVWGFSAKATSLFLVFCIKTPAESRGVSLVINAWSE